MVLVGGILLAGLTVFDLVLVGRDVRKHNQGNSLGIVPWRSREGTPGLALSATF